MTTDFRALCAELVRAWDVTSDFDYNDFGNSVKSIVNRARAALADEPAVPEGREPASVTGQPSNQEGPSAEDVEELCEEHCFIVEGYESIECLQGLINEAIARWGSCQGILDSSAPAPAGEPASAVGEPSDGELNRLLWHEFTTSTGHGERTDPIAFARAVLARWGNPAPAPPAEGEVEELVAWLRSNALTVKKASGNPANGARQRMNRAADLLQRLSPPQPVPVSERPWEREGWCDDQGRCWTGRPLPDAPDRWDWSSAVTDGNVTHCLPHDIPVLPAMISIEDIAAQKALVPVSERLPGQGVEG